MAYVEGARPELDYSVPSDGVGASQLSHRTLATSLQKGISESGDADHVPVGLSAF